MALRWSSTVKGDNIALSEGSAVARTGAKGEQGRAVCSASALPSSGQHFVELEYTLGGRGESLTGAYFTGVLSAAETQTAGLFRSKYKGPYDLPQGFWGVDDGWAYLHRGSGHAGSVGAAAPASDGVPIDVR